ncbi:hypothetical protein P8C59_004729 [Phyllachora maydis]|uniref:DNA polymerase epsilon subunit B n=1 Tax=Phyllachora maydis TaxID=1825666 RepID=A0AAD9MER3_9PEZI|nr:hypothetical protein P8C59_004729 [Phyllachora maydis]
MGLSSLAVGEDPEGGDDGPALDVRSWIRVVGAFEQPRLVYHVEKKHFETDPATPSLFPAASRKTNVFRNRFNVIHQRLLRNETDLTASIALDVQQAVAIPEDSAWFTPGMIVLVDGVYEEEEESVGRGLGGHGGVGGTIGGRFQAFFMGQPPCEKRRTTLGVSDADGGRDHAIGGGFGWIDFLGVGSERAVGSRMRRLEERLLRRPATAEADSPHRGRVVVLGELNLDEPTSLQALGKILGLYTAEPEGAEPLAFILTGNFTSDAAMARGAAGGSIEYKEYFDALASHEIVLFRDDMSARLRRTAVRLNTNVRSVNVEESSTTMDLDPDSPPSFDNSLNGAASAAQEGKVSHDVRTARKLVKTVLDQGYLAPFRQQIRPVHWDFASALHLYPLPTVVILVDTGAPAFCITYEGCHAMNPGRFLAKGRKGVARWIEYDIGKTGRVRECLF